MRFSSKTFKKNRSLKKRSTKKRITRRKTQRGGSMYRNIPKEAVVVNPVEWDD